MDKINKFAHWLNSQPSPTEVCKFLVEDSFSSEGAIGCRISQINNDRSLTFIGEYGHEDQLIEQRFNYDTWRQWRIDKIGSELPSDRGAWVAEHKTLFAVLVNKMVVYGCVAVRFSDEITEQEVAVSKIKSLSYPLSLQLFALIKAQKEGFIADRIINNNFSSTKFTDNETSEDTPIEISERQIAILRLLERQKTNHEIATELGYSVSTIRHDLMDIFRKLKLSSRHEASDRAKDLGLI